MLQITRSYSSKVPTLTRVSNKFNSARSTFNLRPSLPQGLIHNPPASVPNSKNTPKAFLPSNDPRKNLVKHRTYSAAQVENMPVVFGSKITDKSYELTPEIVQQIQDLRISNPSEWTVNKLAKKFNTTSNFIKVTTSISEDRKTKLSNELESVKQNWPAQKQTARINRKRRVELWLRNEF